MDHQTQNDETPAGAEFLAPYHASIDEVARQRGIVLERGRDRRR